MHRGFHVPEAERQEYAQMLKALIDSEKPVIYVDESSFNMWKRSNKTWAPPGSTIYIPIANSRNSSITVYGTIGTCLKQAVFMQHRRLRELIEGDHAAFHWQQLREDLHGSGWA